MSKMLIERAVVEQALHVATAAGYPVALIAALRAALAEPVQEPDSPERRCGGPGCDLKCCQPVQEPVYLEVCCDAHPKWMRVNQRQFDEYVAHGWEGRRLYTTPPQRPAEPQGCDHCNHPLYAAIKCRVCGRAHKIGGQP